MPTTRRDTREWIVQLLFQLDLNPTEDLDAVFHHFWTERAPDDRARRFVEEIVRGVRETLDRLDETLRRYAEHWDVGRMGVVERNMMRMAMYEMLYRDDIPPVVSINEAVDIAKYFGSDESGKFVNGILDRARKDINRPAREAIGSSGTAE
ncbi:MAG: transcription antitermination factor NusB [Verrucomicrobiota bacterium]|nr:transcription antitermination factor NusB [Verrucomicrobiota bacterium]